MSERAVVTAGTGGIGLETAKGLARHGFAVTVVGRNAERGTSAIKEIAAVATGAAPRFVTADLASLGQVRALAAHLAAEGPLKVLVNNVGAMFPQRRQTVDGIESSFAVNHLSPYLLTELLLDRLQAAAPSRIVNVTSAAVKAAKRTFDAAEPPGGYYGFHWYGRAKLAHLAYTLHLAERLHGTGVTVFAATDASLEGQTGVLIGPGARPVPVSRGAGDPRIITQVLELSRRLAPLGGGPDVQHK